MSKFITLYDRFKSSMLIGLLEEEGIAFVVKDESKSSVGEIAPLAQPIHFFINDAEDLKKSQELLEQVRNTRNLQKEESEWTCQNCNETNEGQFTTCWNCLNDRSDLTNSKDEND